MRNIEYFRNRAAIFIAALFFLACQNKQAINIQYLETPCFEGALPFLSSSDHGIYLSWVEYANDTTDVLMFSKLVDGNWQGAQTIASGTDWFVNWADYPSLISFGKEEYLAAHWLQKSDTGTYDYDIKMKLSKDEGRSWSDAFTLHKDSIAAEHGFVSMIPYEENQLFVSWLDGRNTLVNGNNGDQHGHGAGAMTLRSAVVDINGNITDSVELDDRVCDCCQTSAAATEKTLIVAYRDRSEGEVRDISIVRKDSAVWSAPIDISHDGWKIAGCPVNGPSIDTHGSNVALAWYTMKEDSSIVYLKISKDKAKSFGERIRVDEGDPIGRVKVTYTLRGEIVVCWMELRDDHAILMLKHFDGSGIELSKFEIAELTAERSSGFPAMAIRDNSLVLAWTESKESQTIKSALIKIN